MDILAWLAVGIIVWVALIEHDDQDYEIRRGWRLPKEHKWK